MSSVSAFIIIPARRQKVLSLEISITSDILHCIASLSSTYLKCVLMLLSIQRIYRGGLAFSLQVDNCQRIEHDEMTVLALSHI